MSENMPKIQLHFQYIKDVSIENPHPIELLQMKDLQTTIDVDVQVAEGKEESVGTFAVTVLLHLYVTKDDTKHFVLEMEYVGIFEIKDVQPEMMSFIVFVQCPHYLFPSLRHIVRTLSQEAGLPGLDIGSIDFHALFQKKMEHYASQEK